MSLFKQYFSDLNRLRRNNSTVLFQTLSNITNCIMAVSRIMHWYALRFDNMHETISLDS